MKEEGYSRAARACYLACLAPRLYRYGFVESFNGNLCDECLKEPLFINYNHAGKTIEQCRNAPAGRCVMYGGLAGSDQ